MTFLETDVQGSDHICHDLMDDITAIEDQSAESREFNGNAHSVVMTAEGVVIECSIDDATEEESAASKNDDNEGAPPSVLGEAASKNAEPAPTQYQTGLKHFREVLEDWEAFILDDQSPA